MNGILTLSDGRPFTVTTTDQAGTGPGRIARANCIGDAVPDGFNQTLDSWMDPAAFAPTTAADLRQLREQHRARARIEVDEPVGVPLDRRSARRAALELRLETFNLFNWVNYGFPAANISNLGTFGRITSIIGRTARDSAGGEVLLLGVQRHEGNEGARMHG